MTVPCQIAEGDGVVATPALKRSLDVFAAATGLLALAPFLAIAAAAVRWEDGGPAMFWQTRVGAGGALFSMAKLRSMKVRRERDSELTVAGDARITKVGGFIRRYKIDELPQLWNVLVGEMSLVGPRPETLSLMQEYTPAQRRTLTSVCPGLTDWASLILRDESEWLSQSGDATAFYRDVLMPIKCRLWEFYQADRGIATDVRILLATVWAILAPNAKNPWISREVRAYLQASVLAKRLPQTLDAP